MAARRNTTNRIENTHWEVIEAGRMMSRYGLKSAIFVSSPYHMRRIRVIANRILDRDAYRIVFTPTRFETAERNVCRLNKTEWKYIGNEYFKIAWFMIYSTFLPA